MKKIMKRIENSIMIKEIKVLEKLALTLTLLWEGFEFEFSKTQRSYYKLTLLKYDGKKLVYDVKFKDFSIRELKKNLRMLTSNYIADVKIVSARESAKRKKEERKMLLKSVCDSVKSQTNIQDIIDKKISDLMALHSSKVKGKMSKSEKAMIEEIIARNPDKKYDLCRCDSYTKTDLIINGTNYQLKNITSKVGKDGKIKPTQATIFSYRHKNVLGSQMISKTKKDLLIKVGNHLQKAVENNLPIKDRMLSSILSKEEGIKILEHFLKKGNLIQKMRGKQADKIMVWDSNIEGKNALRVPSMEWLFHHTKLEARSASSKQRKDVLLGNGWSFPQNHKCTGEMCIELKLVSTGWMQFQEQGGYLPPCPVKK